MTAGHKHRVITVRRGGIAQRLLQRVVVWRTASEERADRSRFVYSDCPWNGYYRMTLLGFLHPLTGLTLRVEP